MKTVYVKNISLRSQQPGGYSHLLFTDETNCTRLGRVLPFPVDMGVLSSIWTMARSALTVLVPDGVTILQDGTSCISVNLENHSHEQQGHFSLKELTKPLLELNRLGLNHLSIDPNSYVRDINGVPKLIFWGDGLLRVHPSAPPEVKTGGFPGIISDLFMVTASALESGWLRKENEISQAGRLCGNSYPERSATAFELGYSKRKPYGVFDAEDYFTFSVLTGGSWQERDQEVNSLLALASVRGWACRTLRNALGEDGRPLPDTPAGTVTRSPEELLANAFRDCPGIERLLVINDLSEKQEDLMHILSKLLRVIPSGLHVLAVSEEDSLFPGESKIVLDGTPTTAQDVPLGSVMITGSCRSTGPSWYGPRCRMDSHMVKSGNRLQFDAETLFREGAWLRTVSAVTEEFSAKKAESLLRLGRFSEAISCVPEQNSELKARILMGLGNYRAACDILDQTSEPLCRARALRGTGRISEALELLKTAPGHQHLPELAELYDLSGNPSSGLRPLLEGLEHSEGNDRIDILCALRNLEMRLGLYSDALEHSEMAVKLSGECTGISQLVNALQARGRTLLVLGRWKEAGEDFQTAAQIFEENALSSNRPPHIDLFDLELRTGRITQAEKSLETLKRLLQEGSLPSRQMLLMLIANMAALLGEGKEGIPNALRAEELASSHGMELYSGISTLYAARLYLQAGMQERGVSLLRKARAKGHMLVDHHLVCLADIELALIHRMDFEITEDGYSGVKELSEEYLTTCIINGMDKETSFKKLLDLPSPLTACRLADSCGFPDSEELTERIIEAREKILGQLSPEGKKKYLSLFSGSWRKADPEKLSESEITDKLRIISEWIIGYSEGLKSIDSLRSELGLSGISLEKRKSMAKVPGNSPLYISGKRSKLIAPLLTPVAAVLACVPERTTVYASSGISSEILGDSAVMQSVRYEIERYAGESVPILISGETGTGKEICARAIHRLSGKNRGAFVPVDCGAIPENLMESELFGAVPGAYTGIAAHRTGLLQEADKGTLFLDEIGNLPLHMQAKLLRVLDTGIFRKLGETRERRVDLRIVAASNSNLRELTEKGQFRSDLYYRLAVVEIHLPPLRDRLADIEQLVKHFTGHEVSPGALALLRERSWRGNIRELQNVVRRAAIGAEGSVIRSCDIAPEEHMDTPPEGRTLQDAIKAHIAKTVKYTGGNRSEAARILKCDPKTLRKYLK